MLLRVIGVLIISINLLLHLNSCTRSSNPPEKQINRTFLFQDFKNQDFLSKPEKAINSIHLSDTMGNKIIFYYSDNRILSECGWNGSQKEGLFVEYDFNGLKKVVGSYQKNYKNGIWKYYDSQGNLREEIVYKNDTLNGPYKYYYQSGRLKNYGHYVDGAKNGKWYLYHKNGKVWTVSNYENNMLQGKWKSYFPNGNLESTLKYKNDTMHGELILYNEKGKIISKRQFIDGQEVGKYQDFDSVKVIPDVEYYENNRN